MKIILDANPDVYELVWGFIGGILGDEITREIQDDFPSKNLRISSGSSTSYNEEDYKNREFASLFQCISEKNIIGKFSKQPWKIVDNSASNTNKLPKKNS